MSYTTNWLQNNKVAVCLYLYHTDLWPEFKDLLLPLSNYIKLYIGLCKDNPISYSSFNQFDHIVSVHENYGADIAPFLIQLQNIKEPLFIKIHSKKSSWGFKHHINWRQMILNDLISSMSLFKSNIKILISKEYNAVLCNKSMLMSNREFKNSDKINHICKLLNIDYNKVKQSEFVAGSMFMAKTKIYQDYIHGSKLSSIQELLKKETGKVSDLRSGTYSHSMERVLGYIVKQQDLKFCHPKYKPIKVLNTMAPNKKYFNMIHMYNNYCYMLEDPNLYGYIKSINSENITIIWKHLEADISQNYKIMDKNIISKV